MAFRDVKMVLGKGSFELDKRLRFIIEKGIKVVEGAVAKATRFMCYLFMKENRKYAKQSNLARELLRHQSNYP